MAAPDLSGYVTVAERIAQFREKYPDGCLRPVDPLHPIEVRDIAGKTFIIYAAAAYRDRDDTLPGIGVAGEPFPGTTSFTRNSEIQNAETSAWGRAIIAVLAADTNSGIASAEEVRNRQDERQEPPRRPAVTRTQGPAYKNAQELIDHAARATTPEGVRADYKAAASAGWLKESVAHPETAEKLSAESFLTSRGNDLKHKSSRPAAPESPGGSGGE
jgi:hypothetical protein